MGIKVCTHNEQWREVSREWLLEDILILHAGKASEPCSASALADASSAEDMPLLIVGSGWAGRSGRPLTAAVAQKQWGARVGRE